MRDSIRSIFRDTFVIVVIGACLSLGAAAQSAGPDTRAEMTVEEIEDQLRTLVYPAPQSRGADVAAPPASLVLRSIAFEFNSDQLTSAARATLDNLAAAMNHADIVSAAFEIEGHTDAVGTEAYNMSLSRRRAMASMDYLIARGVEAGRLSATGRGESNPVEQTDGASLLNRRVEVRLAGRGT